LLSLLLALRVISRARDNQQPKPEAGIAKRRTFSFDSIVGASDRHTALSPREWANPAKVNTG
jgi:hypothetical protein